MDGVELLAGADGNVVDGPVGQRAGRARLDTLAAGDARALAHRIVEVEGDPRGVTLAGPADDVVALQVVAGPHATVAQDATVVVDIDHRVRQEPPGHLPDLLPCHGLVVGLHHQLDVLVLRVREIARRAREALEHRRERNQPRFGDVIRHLGEVAVQGVVPVGVAAHEAD